MEQHVYTFRMHFASKSLFISEEGIEFETRFHIISDTLDNAWKTAYKWEQSLNTKNPSLKIMRQTLISYVGEHSL